MHAVPSLFTLSFLLPLLSDKEGRRRHAQSMLPYLTPEAGVEVEELPEDLVERRHLDRLLSSSKAQ